MTLTDYTEQIKSSITMRDVAERYGIKVNYLNKALCPFHQDKRPSMHIYGGKRGYYCFVCNTGGDIIDFVMRYFNIPFKDALIKLNDDFDLRLPIRAVISEAERIEAEKEAQRRREEQYQREVKMKQLTTIYHRAFDRWKALDDIKRDKAPKTPLDDVSEDYIYACQHIDQAWEEYVEAERNMRGVRA